MKGFLLVVPASSCTDVSSINNILFIRILLFNTKHTIFVTKTAYRIVKLLAKYSSKVAE